MGGRTELVVSGQMSFALKRHDVFGMEEKKRRVKTTGKESMETGLREI